MKIIGLFLLLGLIGPIASFHDIQLQIYQVNRASSYRVTSDKPPLQGVVGTTYFIYNGTVQFGSNKDSATLLFDTASQYTAVNTKGCTDCTSTPYDDTTSTTKVVVGPVVDFEDGHFILNGNQIKDNVYFLGYTASQLEFVGVTEQIQGLAFDGIFGLGLKKDQNQSFIAQSNVQKQQFALYITNDTSNLTFGGYNTSYVQTGDENEGYGIHWFDLVDNKDEWMIELQDARYGYMTFLKSDANKALFSIGNPYIYIPAKDFAQLSQQWQSKSADVDCNQYMCYFDGDCNLISHEIGPLKLQFSSYEYFSVEPDEYTINGTYFNMPGKCVFGVLPHEDTTITDRFNLGLGFMRNYYTIYDVSKKQIGIALHPQSKAAVRRTFSGGIIALIAISVVVLFPLSILGMYLLYRMRRNQQKIKELSKNISSNNLLLSSSTKAEQQQ